MNIYSAIDELQLLEEILMNLITLELGRWGKKKKVLSESSLSLSSVSCTFMNSGYETGLDIFCPALVSKLDAQGIY